MAGKISTTASNIMTVTDRPEIRRPCIGVAVIIINKGKVLLGKRRGAHGADTWAFPGGHLEFGESIEACARRETLEECGLEIDNLSPVACTNDIFDQEAKHYVTLFIRADHLSGHPVVKEPDKCKEWIWSPWPPTVTPLFLPILNLLKQNFELSHGENPT